jgi:ERCC4-related helicase
LEGMESYFEPADPEEIKYLEDLLYQFENTGEDSKLSHFITILRQELIQRESAIVFTQYTDTMDYLRTALQQLYGEHLTFAAKLEIGVRSQESGARRKEEEGRRKEPEEVFLQI